MDGDKDKDPQDPANPEDPNQKEDDQTQNQDDPSKQAEEPQKQDEAPFDPSQVQIPPNPYETDNLDPNISQVIPGKNDNGLNTSLSDPNYPLSEKEKEQTFLTLQKKTEQDIWKPYDFLFPAGILAQLVQVHDVDAKGFPWNDILNKLKLTEASPVVNLIGAKESKRGQFYAGIARACYNSDAIVLDSAIESGIEKYAMRRGLKLIGVAPENEIQFPQINPTYKDPFELANGHTHLFLLNNKSKNLQWGGEGTFQNRLAVKLSEGKLSQQQGREPCQIVNVLIGDHDNYIEELREAVSKQQPIIVVKGSQLCDQIIAHTAKPKQASKEAEKPEEQKEPGPDSQKQALPQIKVPQLENEEIIEWLTEVPPAKDPKEGQNKDEQASQSAKHLFFMLDSSSSEDIAQYIHFLLTVTPFKKK